MTDTVQEKVMRTMKWMMVGWMVFSLTACGGSSNGDTDTTEPDTSKPDGVEPDTPEPDVIVSDPTWTNDIQAIVAASCSGAGCHTGGQNGGAVNFDSYANTQAMSTNVACYAGLTVGEVMALKVAPSPPCGIQMPIGKPMLSLPDQALFEAWVNAGMPE